jgi:hypothetical protein
MKKILTRNTVACGEARISPFLKCGWGCGVGFAFCPVSLAANRQLAEITGCEPRNEDPLITRRSSCFDLTDRV